MGLIKVADNEFIVYLMKFITMTANGCFDLRSPIK